MIALLAPVGKFLAQSVLMQSPIGGILKRFWKPLLVGLAVLALVLWHGHKVKAFGQERYDAGYAQAAADAKKAVRKVDHKSAEISHEIRSKTDEKIRVSARHADDLRLRGPGRASCPVISAAAGGHEPRRRDADGGLAAVPGGEREQLIALPFGETVDRAEIADANRLEVLAWREWHRRLTDEWAKWKADSEARK